MGKFLGVFGLATRAERDELAERLYAEEKKVAGLLRDIKRVRDENFALRNTQARDLDDALRERDAALLEVERWQAGFQSAVLEAGAMVDAS